MDQSFGPVSYFLTYHTYFIKKNVYDFVCREQKLVILFLVYHNAVEKTFARIFACLCACVPFALTDRLACLIRCCVFLSSVHAALYSIHENPSSYTAFELFFCCCDGVMIHYRCCFVSSCSGC